MRKSFFLLILFISNAFLLAEETIYAIMVTGKDLFHKELAERSIESFLNQTYENKKLIIVNDGPYTFENYHESITEVRPNKKLCLGKLRNLGLDSIPKNAVWVQWDDDDWHHSKLIEEQYKKMKKTSSFAVLLKQQIVYTFNRNSAWTYQCGLGIAGTIMSKNNKRYRYRPVRRSEDSILLDQIKRNEKVHIWNNPNYYYLRFFHGHNTWNDASWHQNKPKNKFSLKEEPRNYLLTILDEYYNYLR